MSQLLNKLFTLSIPYNNSHYQAFPFLYTQLPGIPTKCNCRLPGISDLVSQLTGMPDILYANWQAYHATIVIKLLKFFRHELQVYQRDIKGNV